MDAMFIAITDLQFAYDNNMSPPSSPSAHGGESSPSGPSGSTTPPPTNQRLGATGTMRDDDEIAGGQDECFTCNTTHCSCMPAEFHGPAGFQGFQGFVPYLRTTRISLRPPP